MTRRSWKAAREKVEEEGRCRVCRSSWNVQAAHVIPRSLAPGVDNNMSADNIVPLCSGTPAGGGMGCHERYDSHQLDICSVLTLREQLAAVSVAGGLYPALRRISNRRDL